MLYLSAFKTFRVGRYTNRLPLPLPLRIYEVRSQVSFGSLRDQGWSGQHAGVDPQTLFHTLFDLIAKFGYSRHVALCLWYQKFGTAGVLPSRVAEKQTSPHIRLVNEATQG